jgi:RHS repeat-associated protein
MFRVTNGADGAQPRVLASVQLAVAFLLTTLITFPFALEDAGPDRAAAGSRQRVELVKLRTRTSRTYRNGNGSLTTTLYSGSVNYRQAGRGWRSISSRLVPARRAGYAWKNGANSFQTFFRERLADDDYLRFNAAGLNFGFSLEGVEGESNGTANAGRVSYRDVVEGVDLKYALFADGLKETLVLADAAAPTSYRFVMTPPAGVRTRAERQQDGSWAIFLGSRARPLFVFEAPTAEDAHAVRGGSPRLDITREGRRFALELSLDKRWLHAAKRAFPVLLDPTITIQPSSQDASFNDACPTCPPYVDKKLYIGTTATERWRSAVQFTLGDVPTGANVTDARLKLYYGGSCVPPADGICKPLSAKLDVHRMTKAWSPTSTSSALEFTPAPVSSLNFSTIADADVQWLAWDVTSTVKSWLGITDPQPNYGLVIKRETEPLSASGPAVLSRRYDLEASLLPKLEVTYSGDGVELLPPDTLHANGAELRWTRYTGPSGAPFVKYEVHRSAAPKFQPTSSTLVATIGDQNITSYRDTTAAPSKAFSYRVVANSGVSNERRVTLPGPGNSNKTLQPVPLEGKATYVDNAGAQCTNHGAESDIWLSADLTAVRRGLLHFDLRDIPATASINGARLSVWRPFHAGVNAVVDAYRVTSAWEEGSGSDACTGNGASWAETEGGVSWSSPGVDYDATVVKSYSQNAASWNPFYIEDFVQEWVSGEAPNLGLLLKLRDETPVDKKKFRYYGDDFSVAPTLRPKLFVAYTDGSQAQGPTVSIAGPAGGEQVSGSAVKVAAAASDDRRVDKVEFFVDGGSTAFASDTVPPFEVTWNSTGVANGAHTLSARATDDAGNATTSPAANVTVHNSALPTTSVTSPGSGTTVTGTATVSAAAGDDLGVTKVEFYSDDLLIGEDATAPYSVSWNTLSAAEPAYDGSHTLTTKAYDTGGQSTTSSPTNVTTVNTSGTKYRATCTSTEFPQSMIYNPASSTQDKYGLDVTVTNNSPGAWAASDVVLKYRWYSPDPSPQPIDRPYEVSLGSDLPTGEPRTLRVLAEPPELPEGVSKAEYQLRVDLYSKASAAWFADKGNKPLENPVIVNKALVRDALGFEPYYQFVGEELGAGMRHEVNVANGNSLVRWTPFSAPGRGLDTVLTLTHNALEKKCECPAGNNFSIGISSLTRFGNPIDIHPNKADEIAGRSNKFIEYTDVDGTTHRFTSNDGITYQEPDGVHLFLRRYSTTDLTRKWALTTPDRVTYFYDSEGFPTFVEDRNGNRLTYALQDTPPAEDPGGPKRRITKVTDAGGRDFTITYWAKADKVKSHVRGKIRRITDHSGSPLDFEYYDDGNLRKLIQRGGTNADGSFLADRAFVFTYTDPAGNGPALPLAADRVDPDPKTPSQSTRLYSVRDPRGKETLFSYLGSGDGINRWKLASRTDRAGAVTTYAYDTVNRVTTMRLPLSRVWKYGYDTEGKVTSITNPLDQQTTQAWSGDRMLTKVIEPTGKYAEFAYNANGLTTDEWDQLRNRTTYEYENLPVQNVGGTTTDVEANWKAGRGIPHLSQLKAQTAPKGTATATPTTDYQTSYTYDVRGNLTSLRDPAGGTTTLTYNADGTLASAKDANGYTTTYAAYDANGLATRTVDPRGGVGTRFFNADGLLVWSQDPLHAGETGGDPREYRTYVDYDSFHRAGQSSSPKSTRHERGVLIWSRTKYDPNDNAIASAVESYSPTNAPSTVRTFDAMDRPLVITGPDTSVDPAGERFTYRYDDAGRPVQYTAPKGAMSGSTDQDHADFVTYDPVDRVIRETQHEVDSSGAVIRSAHTHYCFDLAGDLVRTTAPAAGFASVDCSGPPPAATTRMTYDSAHRPTSTIDPGGHETTTGYDANGNITSATDEAGASTTSTYNERDELVKEVEPFDRTRSPVRVLTTMYEYDLVGHVKREISPRAWDASPDKQTFTEYVTAFRYDELGRLIRTDLPTSASAPQPQYVHTTYDANGNVTSHSLPVLTNDAGGVPATKKTVIDPFDTGLSKRVKDPANPAVHFDYDAAGRQTTRTPEDPSGNLDLSQQMTWTYDVDGQLSKISDRGGQSTSYDYDANGNLVTVDEARGITTEGQDPIDIRLTYDGFEQLAKFRQKARNQTDYRFTTYAYDLNGNPATVEEGGLESSSGTELSPGRKYELSYDDTDFISSFVDRGSSGGSADDLRVTSTYKPTGVLASETFERSNGAGGWNLARGTAYDYYDNGLLKLQETSNEGGAVLESHALEYENTGGVYVNGNRTKDTYRLAGPEAAPCQTAACTVTYGYNPRERLVEEKQTRNGVTATTSYTIDTAGNITAVDRSGAVTTYQYIGDQLASRTRGGDTRKYYYDNDGNLDCLTGEAGTKTDCSPPAGSPPSAALRVDFAYDYLDRMSSYRSYGATAIQRSTEYTYNALGRLAEEQELVRPNGSPRTTQFSHFSSGDVSSEVQKDRASGSLLATKAYTYAGPAGRTSLTVTPTGEQATSYAYGRDRHGSVSMLIGQDGGSKASYAYDAYGQADSQLSQGDGTADPLNAYRYTSKRFDVGSSLLDMEARRFDPDDARFLQQDRVDEPGGDLALTLGDTTQNRYALAGGNPVSFVEVDGHSATSVERYQGAKERTHTFNIPYEPRVGVVRGGLFIAACRVGINRWTKYGQGDCRGFHKHAHPSRYRAYFALDYRTGKGRMRVNPSCAKAPVWGRRFCFRPNPISTWIPHRLAWRLRVNRIETGQFLASPVLLTTDLYIKTSLVAAFGPRWLDLPPPPAISNLWEFHRRGRAAFQRYTPIDIGYRRDSYPSMEWYQDGAGRTDTICRQRETSIVALAPPSDDREGFCYSPEGII